MQNPFTQHPHSIGESYFQHLFFATKFGLKMIAAGLSCIVHAIFPFLFQRTGSDILLKATQQFVDRMPTTEERIIVLSEMIEKKFEKHLKVNHGSDTKRQSNCA